MGDGNGRGLSSVARRYPKRRDVLRRVRRNQTRRHMFSVPHSLRVGSLVHAIGLTFGLTVDSDHRRLALPLVERLRRHSAERGISFVLGTVANDPTSPSHRFWTKFAEAFPRT